MSHVKITEIIFNEMLHQVKVLLTLKGTCSVEEIKNQFKNVEGSVVESFLLEAIRRGIVIEEKSSFILQQLEVPS